MTLSLLFDLILGGSAVSIGWHLARAGLARFWPSLLPRAVESIRLVIETDAGCQCPDCTAEREEVVRVH